LSSRKPQTILRNGRLADLPASASDVKAEGWSSLFSGTDYLMFKAAPKDIEKFITESKSIDASPKVFNENHQYLPAPNNPELRQAIDTNEYSQNEYFYRNSDWPEWFDPTINKKGRIYEIPGMNGHNWGEIIINDETNTLYIWVCWS
jgi:hypothetical protein